MNELVFYRCEICGNLVCMIEDSGVTPHCCGQEMKKLIAATNDGPVEKHLPVVSIYGSKVCVEIGSQLHPMTESHMIEWVIVQTDRGLHFHRFKPDTAPKARFCLTDYEKAECVYAYCNVHGLWCTCQWEDNLPRDCRDKMI
ncbi:MAG: desulfoferrodoxin [Clostridia bacterium]|nr:desulfoferrodoxin [Clostridia bacterium]